MLDNLNIDSLKERLKQNVIHLYTFNDVDDLLYYCINDKYVIFDSIILKNYFVNRYGAINDIDFSPIIEEIVNRKGEES